MTSEPSLGCACSVLDPATYYIMYSLMPSDSEESVRRRLDILYSKTTIDTVYLHMPSVSIESVLRPLDTLYSSPTIDIISSPMLPVGPAFFDPRLSPTTLIYDKRIVDSKLLQV
jgi:hypothetical protein